jgi:arsenate reductase (thioredoxin)
MSDQIQPDRASRPLVVLFLCTFNATRSIMAEALLNHLGNGRMCACSAGDRIVRELHPFTLDCLGRHGVPTAGLHSKSWELFFGLGAPPLDYVITVCDDSREDLQWHADRYPIRAHWDTPNPSLAKGADAEKRAAFDAVFKSLLQRIEALLALPVARMSPSEQREAIMRIGQGPPQTQSV